MRDAHLRHQRLARRRRHPGRRRTRGRRDPGRQDADEGAQHRRAARRSSKPLLVEFALRRGGREGIQAAREVCATAESQAALDRLETLLVRAAALGYGDRVSVDFALLRDLDYYTGFIFEGYLPEIGFPLCGGGRYDSLLPKFGYDVPAVGWSAGVERLLIALERRGKHIAHRRHRIDVLVSGADVVATRERAAGNVVRYASSGQDEAALIAEARAHGIPRVVIAEDGDIREMRVAPAPEQRLPAQPTRASGTPSDAHDRGAERRALRRLGRAACAAPASTCPTTSGRKLALVTSRRHAAAVPAPLGRAGVRRVRRGRLRHRRQRRAVGNRPHGQRARRSRLRLLPLVRRGAAHRPLPRRRAAADVSARRDEVRARRPKPISPNAICRSN